MTSTGSVPQKHKYYSAVKPRPNKDVDNNLPHIPIQMSVYKEFLEAVLASSIALLGEAMQTYAKQGGMSTISINDDGMQVRQSSFLLSPLSERVSGRQLTTHVHTSSPMRKNPPLVRRSTHALDLLGCSSRARFRWRRRRRALRPRRVISNATKRELRPRPGSAVSQLFVWFLVI